MANQTTLVATLGGQPQVVTFTLDLLLARGEEVDQVVVLYPASNTRYQESCRRLTDEFAGDFYSYARRPCHFRRVPIQVGAAQLDDIRKREEVELVRTTFHELLAELKDQGHTIHLSLSGGRRVMAMIGLAAAMQYLTPADRIWHIFTPEDFIQEAQNGVIMHTSLESGIVQLIEVPFVPWVAYFPGLKPLLDSTRQELREAGWLDPEERQRCERVWKGLTDRRREALRVFARGLTRPQAAAHLGIEVSTVDSHRDEIVRLCQEVWVSHDGKIDIHFLRDRFGLYLRGIGELYPNADKSRTTRKRNIIP